MSGKKKEEKQEGLVVCLGGVDVGGGDSHKTDGGISPLHLWEMGRKEEVCDKKKTAL